MWVDVWTGTCWFVSFPEYFEPRIVRDEDPFRVMIEALPRDAGALQGKLMADACAVVVIPPFTGTVWYTSPLA